jgi:arylsulfatase A-like enzyme
MRGSRREVVTWVLASLPLAPAAGVLYLVAEWLFFVTKPSATAALTFRRQLAVLVESPMPFLLPLLAAQTVASVISTLAYPRLRAVAVIPAATIAGCLMLILIDNFTYTIFRFGILTAGEALRVVYVTLWLLLIALAAWKLLAGFSGTFRSRHAVRVGLLLAAVFIAAPPLTARRTQIEPGLSLPPAQLTGRSAAAGARPNILFLGVDGIDADLLSAYGYKRPTSPFLDQLRDETLFFENAFSNATRTHGSIVTLLTGRLPFHTRVTFPPTVLQGEDMHRTLPTLLKRLGYTTLQIGMRHYADAEDVNLFGFDAANYRWQNLKEFKPGQSPDTETDVFRIAVAERLDQRLGRLFGLPPVADGFAHVEGRLVAPLWRDKRRVATLVRYFAVAPEPWFVHLHMLDTHCCKYMPDTMHFSDGVDARTDRRDSTVREADDHIRQLFEALKGTGRLEHTIVVISSDHGSEWNAAARIPLMMRFPGAIIRGRVGSNVQLTDVAPTMLAFLGVRAPEWIDGTSVLDPEHHPPARPVFSVSDIDRRSGQQNLRVLLKSGPPNYGAAAAMVILGSQWFDLNLHNGLIRSGEVAGHTRPGGLRVSEKAARKLLTDQLEDAGFRVGNSAGAGSQ